jgi:hypothetical protein
MEHGRASLTAYSAAQYRAAHQVAEGGRIFTDPLATRILGGETVVDNAPGRRAMYYSCGSSDLDDLWPLYPFS